MIVSVRFRFVEFGVALAAVLGGFPSTAIAQVPIQGLSFTQLGPAIASPSVGVSIPGGTSIPASPRAAYSNVTNMNPGAYAASFAGSYTLFDDIEAEASAAGRQVMSMRIPVYRSRRFFTSEPDTMRFRISIGFWNAAGPSGLAGTRVILPSGEHASYYSEPFVLPLHGFGVLDIDVGDRGLIIPQGQFLVGISFARYESDYFNNEVFGVATYEPPVIGANGPGVYYLGQSMVSTDLNFQLPVHNAAMPGLGLELVVPSPGVGAMLVAMGLATLRRQRLAH